MSTVVNQHETQTSAFEQKVKPLPAADKTAGANSVAKGAQAFESRVTQESGAH